MLGRRQLLVFAFVAAAAACTDQAPVADDYRLPPADPSRDPNHLRVGSLLYACGGWSGLGRPDSARVLVDVMFYRRGPDDPEDRPRDSSVQAAVAAGLRPLFTFQFPMVRGRIDTERIPALYATGEVNAIYTVPDPSRYDLGVDVGYNHALSSQDSLVFVSLGGRVGAMWSFINALAGDFPNASAIPLRAMDVRWLEAGGVACLAGARAGRPQDPSPRARR